MSTTKPHKKDTPNQVEEKAEPKKPQTFSTYITDISPINALVYYIGKDKSNEKNRRTMSLAYVDVPRLDKEKKKEECFSYECGEFLRKKLVTGKLVKLEVIHKNLEGEIRAVVPTVGKENIIVSLLEKGYVVLKQTMNVPKIFKDAEQRAKDAKVGVYSEDPVSLCKKRPENQKLNEKESQALIGKTVAGFIKKIEAPGTYIIETPERRQFPICLYAIDQCAFKKEQKWMFDEDAKEAMIHCANYFYKRDVTVEVKEARNGRLYGVVRQDKKDIAEDLLKNGFVLFLGKKEGVPESIKQPYEKAVKEAKKEKKARWTLFNQEEEDRYLREKAEKERKLEERKKNCKIISGAEIKSIGRNIILMKEGQEYVVSLASIRYNLRFKEEKANDLVAFRIKEVIRKQIVGKKFECKEAYREKSTFKGKEVEHVFYDVYAGGKNIALNLFKEGLVGLEKTNDPFKRSFDYDRFLELVKNPVKYVEKEIKTIEKEERTRNKDLYLGSSANCLLEKIISPTKYLIYNPEKDYRMRIALRGCIVPRDEENKELQEFLNAGRKFIRQNVGLNEISVVFNKFEKGEFLCDVSCKKFDFADQLLDNGFVAFIGKEAPNEKIELMKEAQEKIYKFSTVRKPKEQEEAPKPVVQRPKREFVKEIKFGEGKKIYIVGYDGRDVYFYENAEEAKFIEEMMGKLKGIKKGKVEEKAGVKVVVEVKGKFYRAMIIEPVPRAFVVKCIDTGAVIVCGKNRLKPITEELAAIEAPKNLQQVSLIGIKTPVRGKHEEYEASIQCVAEYYNKEGMLYETTLGETIYGKVHVDDVCINVRLVKEGLAVLSKNFKDASEWGVAMTTAEANARETHVGMWKYGEFFDDEDRDQK